MFKVWMPVYLRSAPARRFFKETRSLLYLFAFYISFSLKFLNKDTKGCMLHVGSKRQISKIPKRYFYLVPVQ